MRFTVIGGEDVARRLARTEQSLGGSEIMAALMAAALPVQNRAKQLAPFRTGTLRRSIHMERVAGRTAVAVGTDMPYARRLEYGFAGVDSLGRRYHQAARPYMRPAIESERGAVIREFRAALTDILRRAAR